MVNPFSAGTLTLQEAPSFAWRTNGLTMSRAARPLLGVGSIVLLGALLHLRMDQIFGMLPVFR